MANTREEGCLKKRFYDSLWEATRMAAVQRDYSGHHNIEPYKCLYCPGYHLGHQRGPDGEKIIYKTKSPI